MRPPVKLVLTYYGIVAFFVEFGKPFYLKVIQSGGVVKKGNRASG
jgi:hypothetical protein